MVEYRAHAGGRSQAVPRLIVVISLNMIPPNQCGAGSGMSVLFGTLARGRGSARPGLDPGADYDAPKWTRCSTSANRTSASRSGHSSDTTRAVSTATGRLMSAGFRSG
jgi:hypothetical protein